MGSTSLYHLLAGEDTMPSDKGLFLAETYRLQKLLRPAVVQVLVDAFFAPQLSDTVFTAKTFQHDTSLFCG